MAITASAPRGGIVEENHKMIKPMWQDFLRRGGRVAER